MLSIIGFWTTISKMRTFENTGLRYFLVTQQISYISTHSNISRTICSKPVKQHFENEFNKIFQVYLNICPNCD